jgi:peroxiredoxin
VVNFPAPSLELTNLEGQSVLLSDYLGQVVLVNNWATWCPPCKAEMPSMQAFFETHKDQGFTIIEINSGDPREDVQSFVQENGLTFPIWVDPTSQALITFRNHSLPSSYVIDQDGAIRLAWTGAISLENLEAYVTPLLEE